MPFPFFFFSFWPPPPPPAAGEGSKRDVHLLVQEGAALPSITRSPGSAKCNFISTRNGPRAGHRWRERVSPMQSAQRVPRLNLILPDTLRGSSLSPPSGEEKGPAEGERATGSCEPPHPHQGKRRPLGTLKSAGGGGLKRQQQRLGPWWASREQGESQSTRSSSRFTFHRLEGTSEPCGEAPGLRSGIYWLVETPIVAYWTWDPFFLPRISHFFWG